MSALPLIALMGREKSSLGAGGNVIQYQDALYDNQSVADAVTGAFRLVIEGERITIHIQLRKSQGEPIAGLVCDALPEGLRARSDVKFWAYLDFPFGLTLDYERKFAYAG